MLKSIELAVDDGVDDDDEDTADGTTEDRTKDSLEQLLLARNKKLSDLLPFKYSILLMVDNVGSSRVKLGDQRGKTNACTMSVCFLLCPAASHTLRQADIAF